MQLVEMGTFLLRRIIFFLGSLKKMSVSWRMDLDLRKKGVGVAVLVVVGGWVEADGDPPPLEQSGD